MPVPAHLSFCGSGFLGVYQLAVAARLTSKKGLRNINIQKVVGVSAGALVASVAVCNPEYLHKNFDAPNVVLSLAKITRKNILRFHHPVFPLCRVRENLERVLPSDAYKRASGVLHVIITNCATRKGEFVTQFTSNDDLIQCLLCSCFIPVICGKEAPMFRGQQYMDGSFLHNMYTFDEGQTICISPFAGPYDITPGHRRYKQTNNNCPCIKISNQDYYMTLDNLVHTTRKWWATEKVLRWYWNQGLLDANCCLDYLENKEPVVNPAYGSKHR